MKQLTDQAVAESDIAVLTQYRAQYKEMQSKLQLQYPRVTVSTVAAAQGLRSSTCFPERILNMSLTL